MPGQRCPECGGRLAATHRTNPREDPPQAPDADEVDLAAEDVDHREDLTLKSAILVCQDCGATMQTPEM